MKKISILLSLLGLFSTFSFAQNVIRVQPCTDTIIQKQVDSLKALYDKAGFSVLREASIAMES